MDDNEIKSGITQKLDKSAGQYDLHVSHCVKTREEKQLWTAAFQAVLPDETLRILDPKLSGLRFG